MKKFISASILTFLLSGLFTYTQAAPITPIQFAKGKSGTTVSGRFKGYDDVQYRLRAQSGQTLSYNISSPNDLALMNIFSPGDKPGSSKALLDGSMSDSSGEITLPKTGDYLIQIYQMRNTARQNKVVNYTLKIGVN